MAAKPPITCLHNKLERQDFYEWTEIKGETYGKFHQEVFSGGIFRCLECKRTVHIVELVVKE